MRAISVSRACSRSVGGQSSEQLKTFSSGNIREVLHEHGQHCISRVYAVPDRSYDWIHRQSGSTQKVFGRRAVVIAVGAHPILAPGWSGKAHTDIALVD